MHKLKRECVKIGSKIQRLYNKRMVEERVRENDQETQIYCVMICPILPVLSVLVSNASHATAPNSNDAI